MRTWHKTKVAINGRFLTRPATGVDRYAMELLRGIDRLIDEGCVADGLSFGIAVPAGDLRTSPFKHIPIVQLGWTKGLIWEHFEFPLRHWHCLLLGLCSTGPFWVRKQIVVIHDATPARMPESFGWLFRTWYRVLMPVLGRIARQIVTVSEFSKSELNSAYGIPASKIQVIYASGEHILDIAATDVRLPSTQINPLGRPYALLVGTQALHKNIGVVLAAMGRMPVGEFDLVVVGGQNSRIFAQARGNPSVNVRYAGYVSDSQLSQLFAGASCFVFPSLYEGFGIPLVEAMHMGCPVLASNAAAIPEVCGDAALYFNPQNAQEFRQQLDQLFSNQNLRNELTAKGYAQAHKYSWKASAVKMVNLCAQWCAMAVVA